MTAPRCLESSSTSRPLARRHVCPKSTAERANRNLHSFVAAITLLVSSTLYYCLAPWISVSCTSVPQYCDTINLHFCSNVCLLSESDAWRLVVVFFVSLAPIRWLQHTHTASYVIGQYHVVVLQTYVAGVNTYRYFRTTNIRRCRAPGAVLRYEMRCRNASRPECIGI
jgi:hypothetical protein